MNDIGSILEKYWGYGKFRPLQEDIIHSVLEGKDTLGLMPTGGGKSVTFQVPALVMEKLCLVITPLIALMKDQVLKLRERNIPAVAVYAGLSREEIDVALDNCIYGDIRFLYCSPERLETELFRTRAHALPLAMVTIDEAHCISQWGYDFRPSYLKIKNLREFFPDIPFLALTATATPKVAEDIQDKLDFREKNLLRTTFERKNLVYRVVQAEDKLQELLRICRGIKDSGIIYVRQRKHAREIDHFLRHNKINSTHYHAGLEHSVRNSRQDDWMTGLTRIMVATNAFGMGIDKPDVRFVVHYDLPDAPEAYFQEAGRCGRDGKKAWAILIWHESDLSTAKRRIKNSFPEISFIKKVYESLGNYYQLPVGAGKGAVYDFVLGDFCQHYGFNILQAYNALKFLQRECYLEVTDEIHQPARIKFLTGREELYKFQVSHADYDGFIKLLLRTYPGLFTEYAVINEAFLARKGGISAEQVKVYLQKLNHLGIIHYLPQKQNPVIVFTEERLDQISLRITKENYQTRKENYETRLEAMIRYASGKDKCRSKFLLEYFGEEDAGECGLCDVCQQQHEIDLSNYEFNRIRGRVKELLEKEQLDFMALMDNLNEPEEKAGKVVRWLLDQGKIEPDDQGFLGFTH